MLESVHHIRQYADIARANVIVKLADLVVIHFNISHQKVDQFGFHDLFRHLHCSLIRIIAHDLRRWAQMLALGRQLDETKVGLVLRDGGSTDAPR